MSEYDARAQFVVVRPDFGHNQNKSYAQRRAEARKWADEVKLTCPLLVDNDRKDFINFCPTGRRRRHWGQLYILNRNAEMVYDGRISTGAFPYCRSRLVLDMLLDEKFRKAFREGFPKESKALPRKVKQTGGVAYVEDFESYKDTYEFRLGPRWGLFEVERMHNRGDLEQGKGRKGSTAVHFFGEHSHYMEKSDLVAHAFPQPLRAGHIRFHIRRGNAGYKKTDQLLARFRLYAGPVRPAPPGRDRRAGKDDLAGTVDVRGPKGEEVFRVDGKPARAALSKDGWHSVRVEVREGGPITVSVDGRVIGRLPFRPLGGIGVGCGHRGFYMDDFELFYAK